MKTELEKLRKSHAELLDYIKRFSNDGEGSFKGWEDGMGRNIQKKLESAVKRAERLEKIYAIHDAQALRPGASETLK